MSDLAGPAAPIIPVRSLERAFDLLAALEQVSQSAGLSDLSRATGLSKATARRLLAVMESRGYVQKVGARYQLGAATVPLTRAFLDRNPLNRSAQPVLENLAVVCGETASLFVRQGSDRVVIERVDSPHTLRLGIRVGQRLPLHVGAAGVVLVAAMPDDELGAFVAKLTSFRLASGRIVTPEEFLQRVHETRRAGFAVSLDERITGIVSVAAPVISAGNRTIAAIAAGGPASGMGGDRIERLSIEVRNAAKEIAERYGNA